MIKFDMSTPPLRLENFIATAENAPEILSFVAEWRGDQETGGGDVELDFRFRRRCAGDPDSAVSLLLALARQVRRPGEEEAIAEGVEWFLVRHGETHWDVLNGLCRQFPCFRAVMAGVWGASLSKDLRRKIEMWRT